MVGLVSKCVQGKGNLKLPVRVVVCAHSHRRTLTIFSICEANGSTHHPLQFLAGRPALNDGACSPHCTDAHEEECLRANAHDYHMHQDGRRKDVCAARAAPRGDHGKSEKEGGALTRRRRRRAAHCDPHSYDALVILVGRLVLSYLLRVHCSSACPDPSLSCPDPPRVDCHSVRKVVCWFLCRCGRH
jgi:hypothetical protein